MTDALVRDQVQRIENEIEDLRGGEGIGKRLDTQALIACASLRSSNAAAGVVP